jgi:TusA-related sulfurtransferase
MSEAASAVVQEAEVHDFSNLVCPKPLIQTKLLIKESGGEGPIKVIVPSDSALRLKEMVKKQSWEVTEERKEGFRVFITIRRSQG